MGSHHLLMPSQPFGQGIRPLAREHLPVQALQGRRGRPQRIGKSIKKRRLRLGDLEFRPQESNPALNVLGQAVVFQTWILY